jgi:site-specific DNA-methyltransferase (adenine-specific)
MSCPRPAPAAPTDTGTAIRPNTIICGDCVTLLEGVGEPFADLIFADPPFNIGYKYDVYEDTKRYDEYHAWTEQWMGACRDVLKPTGSFWVAIGDDYAAEVRLIGRRLGLTLRNWVIWHYTFGQNTKRKFARAHTHLFYFTASPTEFVFNREAVLTFSDRQREYNDKRAHGAGKVPDDVWDEFPRVCGTFQERQGWHPCQMPETILARIVRVSSRVGDMVLDPFAGSGTTPAVAKKLSRAYVGIEKSANYARQATERLAATRRLADLKPRPSGRWPAEHLDVLKGTYMEAGVPTARLFENPRMLQCFVGLFNARLAAAGCRQAYAADDVRRRLERLRQEAKLGKIRVHATEGGGGSGRAAARTRTARRPATAPGAGLFE